MSISTNPVINPLVATDPRRLPKAPLKLQLSRLKPQNSLTTGTVWQLSSAEAELINNLTKVCNCIFGKLPTVDEILDPADEREMGESSRFEGGDIADEVCALAVANAQVTDKVDSDSNDDDVHELFTRADFLDLCQ
ncbi:hypothetical protein M405DRAFT_866278 [Rhizopogon salebrosus TDB-379]|nr:hypothetical protein M405DRAFT_866278 [Rhizopogon salebrosus TDB-379]